MAEVESGQIGIGDKGKEQQIGVSFDLLSWFYVRIPERKPPAKEREPAELELEL